MAHRPVADSHPDQAIERPSGERAIGCGSRSNAVPRAAVSSSRATAGSVDGGVRAPNQTAAAASPALISAMLHGTSAQSAVSAPVPEPDVPAVVWRKGSDPGLTPV